MAITAKSIEQRIRDGLYKNHKAGGYDTEFVDAIYELFDKFAAHYLEEWQRLEDNEKVYKGDHWSASPYTTQKLEDDTNAPKPHTPMIHAAIESVKADLAEHEPEIVLKPDAMGSKISARVLEHVANQELSVCGFSSQWSDFTHDIHVGGWTVFESGFDPDMNNGFGGAFIRNVPNTNFMCDPEAADIQDGRGCFTFVRRTRDWFAQRFPDIYEFMKDDAALPIPNTESGKITPTANDDRMRFLQFWVRVYDLKSSKYKVHLVQLGGHQVLYNSGTDPKYKDTGYYEHGEYPFVVKPLFPEKGTALGFGLVDLYKDMQRYSDKLDQFILKNAFLASQNRLLNTDASGFSDDDLMDWSKEIVHGEQLGGLTWFDTKPLPGYLFDYVQLMRQNIKEGSGANDQAQGKTGGGVTAKSAIAALQEMATKRSRGTAMVLHDGFKVASRQMLAVLRQHHTMTREIPVMIDGHELLFEYNKSSIKPKAVDGQPPTKNEYASLVRVVNKGFKREELPIEYFVDVKTVRQTEYERMANNELVFELMAKVPNADPVIMLEMLDIPNKEQYIEQIRIAQRGGMTALQNEVAKLQEIIKQQAETVQAAQEAQQAANAIIQQKQQQSAPQMAQPTA